MLTSTFIDLVIEEVEAAPESWDKHEEPTDGLCLSRLIARASSKCSPDVPTEDDAALAYSACVAIAKAITDDPLPDPPTVTRTLVHFNDNIALTPDDVVALLRKAKAACLQAGL